ncbi:hypothetical protein [Francisella tularensis]|uniref:hypothetical protein n=1 Tax=Francisella tularensis TaxID=263 RepID=UPI000173E5DB|nr:hypothetical protein [Francisella tularensis]ACD30600.1 conserved hypothetical protein [Francisella tularensis subsp. mediasiatica FSC147]MBK2078799.1 hypothetical protein [Francisella tularensis subsp. mediasiatica]MBK2101548.1 hypothetical protein [Francisella tularensis subsp. mediasiatica]MBK2105033.1 hypothetical protein [Francisella tularensis subsp. mediasiatica]MDN9002970.1 hypothetical protein [Francisella tularensis subsp. mediasiatica]
MNFLKTVSQIKIVVVLSKLLISSTGISKSSHLSPVLGCIYLHELDIAMDKLDIIYKNMLMILSSWKKLKTNCVKL